MTMYDVMYEAINEQYENGEITFEQAEELNELAYDKYVIETSKATKAKRDEQYYGITNKKDIYETLDKLGSAHKYTTPNNIHSDDNKYSYLNRLEKNKADDRLKGLNGRPYTDNQLHKKSFREAKRYKDTRDIDDSNLNVKSLNRRDYSRGSIIDYASKSPYSEPSEKRQKLINKLEQPKNMLDHERKGHNFHVSANKNDMVFFYDKKKK